MDFIRCALKSCSMARLFDQKHKAKYRFLCTAYVTHRMHEECGLFCKMNFIFFKKGTDLQGWCMLLKTIKCQSNFSLKGTSTQEKNTWLIQSFLLILPFFLKKKKRTRLICEVEYQGVWFCSSFGQNGTDLFPFEKRYQVVWTSVLLDFPLQSVYLACCCIPSPVFKLLPIEILKSFLKYSHKSYAFSATATTKTL